MIKSKDFYSNINVDDKFIDEVIEKGKLVNINKSGVVPSCWGNPALSNHYGLWNEYCKYEYKNKIYYIVFQCYGNCDEGATSKYCSHFSEYNGEYDITPEVNSEKPKEVFVIYDDYEDRACSEYFTNENDAIKYACYKNYKGEYVDNERYCVYPFECLDNVKELSSITLKYKCVLTYKFCNGLKLSHITTPKPYVDDYLRSNRVNVLYNSNALEVHVNMFTCSKEDAESIGNDIIHELIKFSKTAIHLIGFGRLHYSTFEEFNEYLRHDEIERKRREEEERIKQQELAELARLKAKYEKQ